MNELHDGNAVSIDDSPYTVVSEERMNVAGLAIRARGNPQFHPASVWEELAARASPRCNW